jgi:hypothetical protein
LNNLSYRGHSKGSYGSVRKAQRLHARRSSRAKRIDESLKAPIAKSVEQWMNQPNRFDLPNVDTPKKQERPQDKPFEPKPISHSERMQRLSYHRLYGVTH